MIRQISRALGGALLVLAASAAVSSPAQASGAPVRAAALALAESGYCAWSGGHSTFRRGDRSMGIAHAQCLLRLWGYPLDTDGIFGPNTERAVLTHQNDCRISVDGVIGPITWTNLHKTSASSECRGV
ncbi:MAG: peptidoglycan-binding domain-containing protein [Actinoplanes sp.]